MAWRMIKVDDNIPTITITEEEYNHLKECEARCDYRDCSTCIHSKDGYHAGTEICHECMRDNKYEFKREQTDGNERTM